jgi:hypothetical protein
MNQDLFHAPPHPLHLHLVEKHHTYHLKADLYPKDMAFAAAALNE